MQGEGHDVELSDDQWDSFWRHGFVNLGQVVTEDELQCLKKRIHAIMMGEVKYPDLLMQLDPGGDYGDSVQTEQTVGWKGATENYRKIGDAFHGLEQDDLFMELMSKPLFRHICGRIYGRHADISVYRAMFMNKPAHGGTSLPWHQDGGEWWGLDRDPLVFVWIALDPATKGNGCVEVIPGSHKLGILSRRGHTLSKEDINKYCDDDNVEALEVPSGHAVLCHNFLIHRSGVNSSETPRKAFSVNYIDSRSRISEKGSLGPFGKPGDQFPHLFYGCFGAPTSDEQS